jgi:hypothetical protein
MYFVCLSVCMYVCMYVSLLTQPTASLFVVGRVLDASPPSLTRAFNLTYHFRDYHTPLTQIYLHNGRGHILITCINAHSYPLLTDQF